MEYERLLRQNNLDGLLVYRIWCQNAEPLGVARAPTGYVYREFRDSVRLQPVS